MYKQEAQIRAICSQGSDFNTITHQIREACDKGLFELELEALSQDHATALSVLGYNVIDKHKFNEKHKGFTISWR